MPYKDLLDKKRNNKRYYYTKQEIILQMKKKKYAYKKKFPSRKLTKKELNLFSIKDLTKYYQIPATM